MHNILRIYGLSMFSIGFIHSSLSKKYVIYNQLNSRIVKYNYNEYETKLSLIEIKDEKSEFLIDKIDDHYNTIIRHSKCGLLNVFCLRSIRAMINYNDLTTKKYINPFDNIQKFHVIDDYYIIPDQIVEQLK